MVVVHAAGNADIGIGNLVRSYSLALELKRSLKDYVVVIFECNKEILNFINTDNIEIFNFDSRMNSINFLKDLKLNAERNIYITDLLDIDKMFENFIRSIGFNKLIHLNDSCLLEYKPDVLIDGDGFKKQWNLKNIEILQSPKFHIIKDQIVKNRPDASWNKEKVKEVLICFGGSDPGYYTEKFLDLYEDVCNDIKFKIIIGPGFSKERMMHLNCVKRENIEFLPNVKDIYRLILKSDIVVSMGGGIAYEAMCLGIASAAVGWKYLNYYIDNLEMHNMIKKISADNMFYDLLAFIKELDLVKEIAFNGWDTIDGKASERISDYIRNI